MLRIATLACLAACIATGAQAEIAISRQDCQRLVRHQPAPNVAYQAGVDVHGNAVAPADLGNAPQLELPDVIYIPIEVLIQDKYGIPANSVLYNARAQVGVVEVRGNRVFYEDQELTDPEAAALEAACRERFDIR